LKIKKRLVDVKDDQRKLGHSLTPTTSYW